MTTFQRMTRSQLRTYIDGCHASGQYDFWFTAACREFNRRFR